MWPFDEALNDWFADVKAARAQGIDHDERTVVPMVRNEFAKDRR